MRLSQTVPGNEATALPNPVQRHKRKSKYEYCFTPLPLSLSTISVTSYWYRMGYRGPKVGDWGLAFAVWRAPQKGCGLVGWVLTWEAQCISSGLGSNLAVLDKSEPCGYGSVPSPSYADLTAKTIYAHASPLNGTKLINWSCATFCQLRGGLRVLCSTLCFLPGPTQQQNTSTSWPSLCPGKPHHQPTGTFPSPPFFLEYGQWWVSWPFPFDIAGHDCLPHLPQPAQYHPGAEPLLQWSQSSSELL